MAMGQKWNNTTCTIQGCSTASEDGGIPGYNAQCCGIRYVDIYHVYGGYGHIPPMGNIHLTKTT